MAGNYDPEKLLHRNQFVLGPGFADGFPSWRRTIVDGITCVTSHPDLTVEQAECEGVTVTLLGYALDPHDPAATNRAIIDELARKVRASPSMWDWIEALSPLGGRWILVIDDGEESRLFHDAGGLRQIFHSDVRYTERLWCASQPGLIAERLGLTMSSEAVDFASSVEFAGNPEHWWPGVASPYREIEHLLPNHYLSLRTGRSHRYWPRRPLESLELGEAVERISWVLRQLVRAAANRFDLSLHLTAGLDSRTVLAASRELRDGIACLTVQSPGMPEDDPDLRVASRLCSRLGVRHEILRACSEVDEEFATIYERNVWRPHEEKVRFLKVAADRYHWGRVSVTGTVSEVGRCYYRLPTAAAPEPTAESVCLLTQMGLNPFPIRYFERWLAGLGDVHGVGVLDLLYWENRVGNWLSMCFQQSDIAWRDEFTPFNSRALLTDLLSLPERERRPPESTLYRELIGRMWPEALAEPVNPPRLASAQLREWTERLRVVRLELAELAPAGESFVLVDDDAWEAERWEDLRALPFLERHGFYWGYPPDDDTAIRELERMRREGASLLVIGWPAFWWLNHYTAFRDHVYRRFRRVLENERLVAFDLGPTVCD